MNPQIKARWVAALRSGLYKPGRQVLHRDDTFCCWGVLCDLHRLETGGEWVDAGRIAGGGMLYLGNNGLPPAVVEEWAGTESRVIVLHKDVAFGFVRVVLSTVNDRSDSPDIFAVIADLIEEQL